MFREQFADEFQRVFSRFRTPIKRQVDLGNPNGAFAPVRVVQPSAAADDGEGVRDIGHAHVPELFGKLQRRALSQPGDCVTLRPGADQDTEHRMFAKLFGKAEQFLSDEFIHRRWGQHDDTAVQATLVN